MSLAARPLEAPLARTALIVVVLAAAGLWLGSCIAATGWSAFDGAVLALLAPSVRQRMLAFLAAGVTVFATSGAIGFYASTHRIGDPWHGSLHTVALFGIASLLALAGALAEQSGRPEAV